MIGSSQSIWRREFVARHPLLFAAGFHGPDGPIAVGDGWRGVVGAMLVQMTKVLDPSVASIVAIDRIESKYGTMRTHVAGLGLSNAVRRRIEEAADLAEARSAHACEICGADGRLFETPSGWLVTACDAHGDGVSVGGARGDAGLVVRRVCDGGRLTIVSCKRYARSEDRLVDIDPHSVGLEE